ncbi:MAG TPA: L,D-transpeptidase [Chlamydiales bacterium]|nr:L,D-transpeptidase [Chlamydiales bacterium]
MSVAKYFLTGGVLLFGAIAGVGYWKRLPSTSVERIAKVEKVAKEEVQELIIPVKEKKVIAPTRPIPVAVIEPPAPEKQEILPDANRIEQLFTLGSDQLPIVETISYTSRAPWIQGRPAWIADYAAHYGTSRHFIARSLNHKPDYLTQKVSPGDRFNVFKEGKNLEFYLLIDLSRCRMWFYYLDLDQNERVLLKTYRVGLGKLDVKKKSGALTPVGKYRFGEKVAIYKPGVMGYYQDEQIEMIRVFGTRWIPFEKELEGCSESARGLGLHGAPWIESLEKGVLVEDVSKIGKYESDGCVRLSAEDIEEIFAIVITKPTTIELVKDFYEAKLPGVEKER